MKQTPYKSIRKVILASMILLPFIPFILSLGIGYTFFKSSLENNTVSSMKRIVADHRQMIESFLSERRSDLEFILYSYSFSELGSGNRLKNVFDRLQKESNAFVDLGVFNESGVHIKYCGPFELTGKNYAQEAWFREVIRHGYYISDIFMGFRKVPHFIIALAREENGSRWVIRATIDTLLFNRLVEEVRIGSTGEAYILNADNVFQTRRRSGGRLMETCPERPLVPDATQHIRTFIGKDIRGEKYLYATAWMKDKKWLLVARQEKADAFAALFSATTLIILISIIGGIVIVAVAFYLTHHIIRRLEQTDAEKYQLNRQLIRASRLAELGEMSTGFAHEINNPLQIIKNENSLIAIILSELKQDGSLKPSPPLKELEESLDQINIQIQRCAKITASILKFGRKSEPVDENVDLLRLIPEISQMVTRKAGLSGIEIRMHLPETTPPFHGDPAQLQQVLINLFNNAIDAVTEKHGVSGGELAIETGPAENGQVIIHVKDNGCGISEDNLKKIFTPFFTTKPVGKGTGLGLSVCFGIVNSMGGTMAVESREGKGTTFTLRLPAATA